MSFPRVSPQGSENRSSAGPTVLLTGGTGFLGSNLLKRLLREGYQVVLLKRSFSRLDRIHDVLERIKTYNLDEIGVESVFEENRIDLLIHCATDYGRKSVPASTVIHSNLVLPLLLLEQAEKHGVSTFINTDTILDKRISWYSLSKRQFSDWLGMFSNKLVGINIALEHFYGPGDDRTKFVSNMIGSILSGVDRIELTRGEQKRDFIFIDDVIDAFMTVIHHHSGSRQPGFFKYEVGTGYSIEIREFMKLLKRLTGNTSAFLDFGALPYRENEVMESVVNLKPLAALGWKAKVTLEEGLLRTIAIEEKGKN